MLDPIFEAYEPVFAARGESHARLLLFPDNLNKIVEYMSDLVKYYFSK